MKRNAKVLRKRTFEFLRSLKKYQYTQRKSCQRALRELCPQKMILNLIQLLAWTSTQQTLLKARVCADIFIVQDLLSSIIDHSSPVLTLPSGLTLMSTIFGHTISGTSTSTAHTATTKVNQSVLASATTAMSSKDIHLRNKRLCMVGSHHWKVGNSPNSWAIPNPASQEGTRTTTRREEKTADFANVRNHGCYAGHRAWRNICKKKKTKDRNSSAKDVIPV